MKKWAQITVFIILGIILFFFFFYIFQVKKTTVETVTEKEVEDSVDTAIDIVPIKSYFEQCLRDISENAIYKIGLHGGYILPEGDSDYDEEGTSQYGSNGYITDEHGYSIPYYLDGNVRTIPSIADIETRLAKMIITTFENCFTNYNFTEQGFNLSKEVIDFKSVNYDYSELSVDSKVIFTEQDTQIQIKYPFIIQKMDAVMRFSEFSVTIPIRFKKAYDIVNTLVNNIQQSDYYDITASCSGLDEKHMINVYTLDNGIVQIVDFSAYFIYIQHSYKYQFAIKNEYYGGLCQG
jgi:hypothetical protein